MSNLIVKIKRELGIDHGTFGVLTCEEFTCKTGELPWKDNQSNVSCIPKGTYTAKMWDSPHFGKVYKLEGTSPREYVLIHTGNFCGDTTKGFKSDVKGCILLGRKTGIIGNQKAIQESKLAFVDFMKKTNNRDLTVIIE